MNTNRFRVWDLVAERMVHEFRHFHFAEDREGIYVIETTEGIHLKVQEDPLDYSEQEGVLMQSTGLTDDQGTLIYEDDIIDFQDRLPGVVEYAADTGGWVIESTDSRVPLLGDAGGQSGLLYDGRVAGNRHENPELIGDS